VAQQQQPQQPQQQPDQQQQPRGAVRAPRQRLPSYAMKAVRTLGAERRRLVGISVGLPSKTV
jgi:hypothetical protein